MTGTCGFRVLVGRGWTVQTTESTQLSGVFLPVVARGIAEFRLTVHSEIGACIQVGRFSPQKPPVYRCVEFHN